MHGGVEGVRLDDLDVAVLGDVVSDVDGVTVRVCLGDVHDLRQEVSHQGHRHGTNLPLRLVCSFVDILEVWLDGEDGSQDSKEDEGGGHGGQQESVLQLRTRRQSVTD